MPQVYDKVIYFDSFDPESGIVQWMGFIALVYDAQNVRVMVFCPEYQRYWQMFDAVLTDTPGTQYGWMPDPNNA